MVSRTQQKARGNGRRPFFEVNFSKSRAVPHSCTLPKVINAHALFAFSTSAAENPLSLIYAPVGGKSQVGRGAEFGDDSMYRSWREPEMPRTFFQRPKGGGGRDAEGNQGVSECVV